MNSQRKELMRFMIVGVLSTILNLSMAQLSRFWFDFNASVIIGSICATIFSFLGGKYFVFQYLDKITPALVVKYLLVHGFGVFQIWLFSYLFLKLFKSTNIIAVYPEIVANFIGISIMVVTSFFGHKFFSFKQKVSQ